MNMTLSNGFCEITQNELEEIDGGGVWTAAIAFVTLCGATAVGAFNAGRQFVRDIRNR